MTQGPTGNTGYSSNVQLLTIRTLWLEDVYVVDKVGRNHGAASTLSYGIIRDPQCRVYVNKRVKTELRNHWGFVVAQEMRPANVTEKGE